MDYIYFMRIFFLVLTVFLFSSTLLFAEYRLEPANCTLKKKSNCGAYLYNSSTGATYFCDLEKCKEVMAPIEVEVVVGEKKSFKSKIPKFKKKKSKIPKFKKKKSE